MTDAPRGRVWGLEHSLWILWTLVPTLGFIAFFWIGYRARHRTWLILSALYFVFFCLLLWIAAATIHTKQHDTASTLLGLYLIGSVIVTLVHAVLVRPDYLLRLQALKGLEPESQRQQLAAYKADYGDTGAEQRVRALFDQCNQIVMEIEDEPELMKESLVGETGQQYIAALQKRDEGSRKLDHAKLPHEYEEAENLLQKSLGELQQIQRNIASRAH